jgi:hypothetical protein
MVPALLPLRYKGANQVISAMERENAKTEQRRQPSSCASREEDEEEKGGLGTSQLDSTFATLFAYPRLDVIFDAILSGESSSRLWRYLCQICDTERSYEGLLCQSTASSAASNVAYTTNACEAESLRRHRNHVLVRLFHDLCECSWCDDPENLDSAFQARPKRSSAAGPPRAKLVGGGISSCTMLSAILNTRACRDWLLIRSVDSFEHKCNVLGRTLQLPRLMQEADEMDVPMIE